MGRSKRPRRLESEPEKPAEPTMVLGGSIAPWASVTLRTPEAEVVRLSTSNLFQQAAMKWAYFVANRQRWRAGGADAAVLTRRAVDQLKALGIGPEHLDQIAKAGVVEVSIAFHHEEVAWEARVFPWEYMLSAATKSSRGEKTLTVVRHLDCAGRAPRQPTEPASLAIIQSAPGKLAEFFGYEIESELIHASLAFPRRSSTPIVNPDADRLRETLANLSPAVLHMTGLDTHQGAKLLRREDSDQLGDGAFLKDQQECPVPVEAAQLAKLLNAGSTKPRLVTLNLHHSGARTAALIVAEGAEAAIGFQDVFEDEWTDQLFARFYYAWRLTRWDLLRALEEALNVLPKTAELGSGVVLWSARSLLATQTGTRRPRRAPNEPPDTLDKQVTLDRHTPLLVPGVAETAGDESASQTVTRRASTGGDGTGTEGARTKPPGGAGSGLPGTGDGSLRDLVRVDAVPHDSLNYSLLHNDRGLFKSFTINKLKPGYLRGVQVVVVLHADHASFPYRTAVDLTEEVTPLTDKVKVPLTSTLARSVMEAVQTSLYVEVSYAGQQLHCDTHRVTLLPVDQWADNDAGRMWLPSFVLPRDPVVPRIVDAAQRYLMVLTDDGTAGFDGYQSVDQRAEDPDEEGVDLQVQAIWAALTYNFPLDYINPPPSYGKADQRARRLAQAVVDQQRLRPPSQVIEGRRGTCIDLALLLASCLEYVGILPVVFLLRGHAFAGYWRGEGYYEKFHRVGVEELADVSEAALATQGRGTAASIPAAPWMVPETAYPEIVQRVLKRELVPLETVCLTQRGGFGQAGDLGMENLRSQTDFESMIDIQLARLKLVTPLPLGGLSA